MINYYSYKNRGDNNVFTEQIPISFIRTVYSFEIKMRWKTEFITIFAIINDDNYFCLT